MSLLQNWRDIAYNQEADKKQLQQFWTNYFLIEKNIYEQLLSNPDEVVKGTVKELAEKYKVDVMTMVGFLDGINDSLVIPNPIEEMEEDTVKRCDEARYPPNPVWKQVQPKPVHHPTLSAVYSNQPALGHTPSYKYPDAVHTK